jgi:P-type E1-E2 ATPase
VAEVIPFHGQDADEMLRVAACLEEHFPHSMANAVVAAAKARGLGHQEMHTKVEYIVAHGIASRINRKTALIGSYHFIFEDEKVRIDPEDREKFEALPDQYSLLYLAIGKVLSAVICISDPLRPEAREIVAALKDAGFSKTVMLTGDSERTAAAIAAQVGIDEFRAEVLPEDKADFIRAEQARGRTVVMVGDGINDAPALSLADVGIAIGHGAAIAREVADITIQAEDLEELVYLKKLSDALMRRISRNYRFILGFNGGLIGLGALGILPPATSALLHNGSTVLLSVNSMTPVLRE